jgi:ABC-type uncharacterized transport system YnjBCD ATPase subunit
MPNDKPMFRQQDDETQEAMRHTLSIFLKAFEDTIPPTLAGFEEVRQSLVRPDLSDDDLSSAAEAFGRLNVRLRRSVRERALEIATVERAQAQERGNDEGVQTERSWADMPYPSQRAS